MNFRVARGIEWKNARLPVRQERLFKVRGGKKFEIEACFPDQVFGKRRIQADGDDESAVLCGHGHPRIELICPVPQRHFDGMVVPQHLPPRHDRNLIPLLRRWLQTDCTTGRRPHTVMDQFYPRSLLIEEETVVLVAEDEDVQSRRIEIFRLVHLQLLPEGNVEQQEPHYDEKTFHREMTLAHHSILMEIRGYLGSRACVHGDYSLISDMYFPPQR